jgi:hypothetical protein
MERRLAPARHWTLRESKSSETDPNALRFPNTAIAGADESLQRAKIEEEARGFRRKYRPDFPKTWREEIAL